MRTFVTKRDGSKELLNFDKINNVVEKACHNLDDVSTSAVVLGSKLSIYEGISTKDIDKAMIFSARSLIESEPNYSYVAARLLLNSIYKEVFGISTNNANFDTLYRALFIENIEYLVSEGIYDPRLLDFDLELVASQLVPANDLGFKYLGLQTIYDRYLKKDRSGKIRETPQAFYMRVAMGQALPEKEPYRTTFAIQLYKNMSSFKFSPSTPTLFNAGTTHSQMSSCFLSTLDDSTDGIMGEMLTQAKFSKFAGGLGLDITPIRGSGSKIRTTNGTSSGLIPYAVIFNYTLIAFNQAGLRYGSGCLYLQPWHLDTWDFLQLRKNTGDERRRAHNTSTAIWMNDLLMEYKETDRDWYLFCPDECPLLCSTYGAAFKTEYEEYVRKANAGLIKNFKKMSSKKLMKEIYTQVYETGHPFITFKDSCNIRYANKHVGIVNSSNLCCMTGDQRVATDRGLLTVKELYDLGGKNKVVGRLDLEDASEMLLPRPNTEIVKIITKHGYTHKVTPDHKVWVKDFGWKEAKDLVIGDKLLIQQIEGMFGVQDEKDLAFLAGMISGDGTLLKSTDSVRIDVWENDFSLLEEIENKVLDVTGYNSKFIIKEVPHSPVLKASLTTKLLATELINRGFNYSKKLSVPEFVWKGTRETVGEYLRGVYFCDASIQAIKGNQTTIFLSSICYSWLEEIQILLANFGIKSNLTHLRKEKSKKLLPDGKGGKKQYGCQPIFRLLVTSIKGCKLLNDIIRMGEHKKHGQFLENITKDGYVQKLYTPFVRLEKCENEDAYCLNVFSDEHSWTVNGLITKNTEIIEHTKPSLYDDRGNKVKLGETAVCTLSSPNIMSFVNRDGHIDYMELASCLRYQVRALDNVLDENFYPADEAANSAKQNRQIGIGVMGIQDYLQFKGIPYDSEEAVKECSKIQEFISLSVIEASIDLAAERGHYPNYPGSDWSQGILPQDAYILHHNERFPDKKITSVDSYWDWTEVRVKLKRHGIRNGNLLATAPTACVTKNTIVATENGLRRIKQLGNISGEQWQPLNINVYQTTTKTKADKFYNNGLKECLGVTTASGRYIECTPNHRLKILDSFGRYVWKYVNELTQQDTLVFKIGLLKDKDINIDKGLTVGLADEMARAICYFEEKGNLVQICDDLINSSYNTIRSFLYTLFKTKATLANSEAIFASKNSQLMRDVKILLDAIGIPSKATDNKIVVSKLDYEEKFSKGILAVTFDKIVDVKSVGMLYTLDISVPENNEYIANSFVSHNTISYIVGCSQSIEPDYSLLYSYQTLSGKFTMINNLFVRDMKRLGLWGKELMNALKTSDGDISLISGIPDKYKDIYKSAFNRDIFKLIDCAAARQIWIDQGQSFNIYYNGTSIKQLDNIYTYCWKKLLKTTYYLRSESASKVEKSTVSVPATKPIVEESSCSIEAMKRGEVCESCQ